MDQRAAKISSIILCGGNARRLGGVEKPLLTIDGTPIVAALAARLGALGPILISANREQERYRMYGVVVADTEPDSGPLAGLLACAQQVETNQILVIPGDCPDYSLEVAHRLLQALSSWPVQAVCAHDGQRRQHLHLALERSVIGSLEQYLTDGGRSVRGWLEKIQMETVDCSDMSDAFADIDSPDDLNRRRSLQQP